MLRPNAVTITLFLNNIKLFHSYASPIAETQKIIQKTPSTLIPPIVYTIAGSDSGGGAGIQADLHAIHNMNCHGCSAITSLTAQNSQGVTAIYNPPSTFLKSQLDALWDDLPARAIKIGMLGSVDVAKTVGTFLKMVHEESAGDSTKKERPFVVVDPVMISTSGHRLVSDEVKKVMTESVFPYADLLTPNTYEAEVLLGRKLTSFDDVEQGAKDLLKYGIKAVLIKGGHPTSNDEVTNNYAQDYFLSSLSSNQKGIWLRCKKYDTDNTHGTGCTLSSAIASAYAIGHLERESIVGVGATKAIQALDACVLGKAYVTAGIERAVQFGKGSGPVAHTQFPSSYQHFPSLISSPTTLSSTLSFIPLQRNNNSSNKQPTDNCSSSNKNTMLGSILPVVDSIQWVQKLSTVPGITDVQLRIKNVHDAADRLALIQQAQDICEKAGIRLWINDFWKEAIQVKSFGIHLGQEDLELCMQNGGLEEIAQANIALGLSTHSYSELALSLSIQPSYISLGPVFATSSKKVAFDPQGLDMVRTWRQLIHPDIPLVVIGGINTLSTVKDMKDAGADCVAVIGAITREEEMVEHIVKDFIDVMLV